MDEKTRDRRIMTLFDLTKLLREGRKVEVSDEFGAHILSDSGQPGYINVDGTPEPNGVIADWFGFYDINAPGDADVWKIEGFVE